MKNILLALRSLTKRGQHNILKIASLSIGMAVGLLLVAKIWFEQSYDDFYPDSERIWQVYEFAEMEGELMEFQGTSGAVAIGMREFFPEVETSTRRKSMSDRIIQMTDDNRKRLSAVIYFADSCYFDVLPRPMVMGDAKETLARPAYALVSRSMAEAIGDDVVGKTFTLDGHEDYAITVGGIFEDYPENSSIEPDIFLSMETFPEFYYDTRGDYIGNDSFRTFLKLREHTSIDAIEARTEDFVDKYLPQDLLQRLGADMHYTYHRVDKAHSEDPDVQRSVAMLGLIAFALLFTAVMNYILIVVSSIVNRTREIAVRKTYGASEGDILRIVFSEAAVHIVISLVVALLILFACREIVYDLVGITLPALLLTGGVAIGLVCLVILLITGVIPGTILARIPVAAAFRNIRESKRLWKLALLFIQFTAASFLVIMLLFTSLQYNRMVDDDPGYDYKDLVFCEFNQVADSTHRATALAELRRLPEVASVTYGIHFPKEGYFSGNPVHLPGEENYIFTTADLSYAGVDYLDTYGIKLIAGRNFNPALPEDEEVLVSRSFVEQLKQTAGWTDDVVGKSICVAAHDDNGKAQIICGVYEDFRISPLNQDNYDRKGSVLYYSSYPFGRLMIRFANLTPSAIKKVESVLSAIAPDKDIQLYSYADEFLTDYDDTRKFRDAVLIGGIVTLAIVFIGLVGYTMDEVNRRSKEMAIRKINGASIKDIMRLFLGDVLRMALPAVVIGCLVAYIVLREWLQQYAEKVALSWYYFAAGGVAVLLVVLGVAAYNVYEAATENPVRSLKSE